MTTSSSQHRQHAHPDRSDRSMTSVTLDHPQPSTRSCEPPHWMVWTIDREDDGVRVTRYIQLRLPGFGIGGIAKAIRRKDIRINNRRCKLTDRLQVDDRVAVHRSVFEKNAATAERPRAPYVPSAQRIQELQDCVIDVSDSLVVLNKPRGWTSQGGKSARGRSRQIDLVARYLTLPDLSPSTDTRELSASLPPLFDHARPSRDRHPRFHPDAHGDEEHERHERHERHDDDDDDEDDDRHDEAQRDERDERDERTPLLVHRLDADTTGVMVMARGRGVARAMTGAFYERSIRKVYLAAVWGHPAAERHWINDPLPRGSSDNEMVTAETHYRVLASRTFYRPRHRDDVHHRLSLLAITPLTGRFHQIRRHLMMENLPILGDHTTGVTADDDILQRLNDNPFVRALATRTDLHLHAYLIAIPAHVLGSAMTFVAPPASPFNQTIANLFDDFSIPSVASLLHDTNPHATL